MASQQPRPAWFRLSSLAGRAPAPATPPARPPAPAAARPSFPIRPPSPSQTQEPLPTATPSRVASPPAAAPPRPPAAPATAPPSTSVARPPPTAAPTGSPAAPPAAPPKSPVAPPARARSPIAPPAAPQPLPPKAPAAAPPTAATALQSSTPAPRKTSPVQKTTSITSTNATASSSSVPTSPKTKTQPPSSSMPTSSVSKPAATASAGETVNGKANARASSPKTVKPLEKTPPQSPKNKPLSHPPSPFTLPPAQIKPEGEREPMIEQKDVLVQQTIDKPTKIPRAHNNGISYHEKREPTKKDKGMIKKLSDSEEKGMSVITLAGDNKGAVMELNSSHKKNYWVGNPQSLQKNKGSKSGNANGDQSGNENGEEGKSSDKGKTNRGMTMQHPTTAFLNSNVQGINNSIVYNCAIRHNDPGIHLSLTRKANGSYKD